MRVRKKGCNPRRSPALATRNPSRSGPLDCDISSYRVRCGNRCYYVNEVETKCQPKKRKPLLLNLRLLSQTVLFLAVLLFGILQYTVSYLWTLRVTSGTGISGILDRMFCDYYNYVSFECHDHKTCVPCTWVKDGVCSCGVCARVRPRFEPTTAPFFSHRTAATSWTKPSPPRAAIITTTIIEHPRDQTDRTCERFTFVTLDTCLARLPWQTLVEV